MDDVQRYMVVYAPGIGEYAIESESGRWVQHSDHAAKVRELEAEIERLRSVCRQAAWLAKPISKAAEDRLLIARVDKLVQDLEQAGQEATYGL